MLEQILKTKELETARRKGRVPLQALLERCPQFEPISLTDRLRQPGVSIIAEIKYRSPSHGPFRCQLPVQDIARDYLKAGARALSILTDQTYFGGSLELLSQVSELFTESSEEVPEAVPLLRKDFLIDRYQVVEARYAGASAFLLIVACLAKDALIDLFEFGKELKLEALVEVHDPYELETALEVGASLIGVNNRDLKTFRVNLETSFQMARLLEGESNLVLVAESGLSDPIQISELHDAGFDGFLIGATFMESSSPGERLAGLLEAVRC